MNDLETGKNENSGKNAKLPQKFLIFFLIILSVVLWYGLLLQFTLKKDIRAEYESMCSTAATQAEAESRLYQTSDLYQSMCNKSSKSMFSLVRMRYDGQEITPEILDQLNDDQIDDNTYFFMDADGKMMTAPGSKTPELDEKQISRLKRTGTLETDSALYFLDKCSDGYILASLDMDTDPYLFEVLDVSTCYDELFCDPDSKDFVYYYNWDLDDATEEKIAETENLYDLYWGELDSSLAIEQGEMEASLFSLDNSWNPFSTNLFFVVKYSQETVDSLEEYLFIPFRSIIFQAMKELSLPLLMMLLFAGFSVFSVSQFQKYRKDGKFNCRTLRLFKNCNINLTACTNILFLQLCIGLLIIAASVSLCTLWHFTSLYDQAKEHLEDLAVSYEEGEEAKDTLQSYFEDELIKEARICSEFLDQVSSGRIHTDVNDYLSQMKDLIGANEISVCDKNGKIIYSTDDYIGYSISSMEDDSEYQLWSLLNGENSEIVFKNQEENLYCGAVRRTDGIGLVMVERSNSSILPVQKKLSVENSMRLSGFGSSDKLYAMQSAPNVLYRIQSDNSDLETLNNSLPQLGNLEEYSGISKVSGELYFVCGKGQEDIILYNADQISQLRQNIMPIAVSMTILCVIISFLALYPAVFVQRERSDAEEYGDPAMGEYRKKKLLQGARAVFAVAVFMMVLDCISSGTSVLYFLFAGNWNKGINIFSFSTIVISLILIVVILKLLGKFFSILENGLPSNTATILQMVNSVINVIVVIFFVVNSFEMLGVNMQTIIAGIGVTGLAIGMGAKDTISDLVAGIFIILDGHIRVGDMIKVNGFYGQVIHMGVRNTKVRCENQEISIHNSAMTNVINYSRGGSRAIVQFSVAADVTAEQLRKLIEQKQERFQQACNNNLLGNVELTHLVSFGYNGCSCFEIAAPVEEINRLKVTYEMNEVLKMILDENHIIINPMVSHRQ